MTLYQQLKAHFQAAVAEFRTLPVYTPEDDIASIQSTHLAIEKEGSEPVHESITDIHRISLNIEIEIPHKTPLYPKRTAIYGAVATAVLSLSDSIPEILDLTIGQNSASLDGSDKKFTATIPIEFVHQLPISTT